MTVYKKRQKKCEHTKQTLYWICSKCGAKTPLLKHEVLYVGGIPTRKIG